jgi:hypothetical protein
LEFLSKVGRHNIDFICGELQVDPSKAVLVGDATSDFSNVDTSKGIGVPLKPRLYYHPSLIIGLLKHNQQTQHQQ